VNTGGEVDFDFADVQALARFAHGKLVQAAFVLVKIRDAAAARAWCAQAPVTNAVVTEPRYESALQLAFSASGLRAIGLAESMVQQFAPEFLSGMAGDANRSRRLGDLGDSAPGEWSWGAGAAAPDMVALLYSTSGLEGWREQVTRPPWNDAFAVIQVLPTSNMSGREPFGFTDGVSQPELDWAATLPVATDVVSYRSGTAIGEVLLGYPNEYGLYTSRPLIDPADDPLGVLSPAPDSPSMRDLGRNGSYLVLRTLEQDVRAFWRFIDAQSGGDAAAREQLGASFVGRRRDGQPLIPGAGLNGFDYRRDPYGQQCPLGAHIRRANPRSADFDGAPSTPVAYLSALLGLPPSTLGRDAVSPTRFHRLLRRGREYGQSLSIEEALAPASPDEAPRGLQFVCLNANLVRQFEFVQGAWLMNSKFDAMRGESDPLLGARRRTADEVPTDGFSIPSEGRAARRIEGLPRFVRVRGGAYFFMPSLRALRFMTRSAGPANSANSADSTKGGKT
jgi:deferrochelatase/peroxidase EfeB